MTAIPNYRPKQLSLGPLEAEILDIVWQFGCATVKDIHDHILSDPDRELAYTSVTTVLNRLTKKGWLVCDRQGRAFYYRPMVTKQQAQAIEAQEHLHRFLAVGSPEIVAAFADNFDRASVDQLKDVARRIDDARKAREQ
ncbi:BlaI/MecI/CopY family transcriptional regulator [Chlorogloea sp. CCALA 695]|uniref:BlaI/MecI/CopY family transcriptional regulator n=1 Tax=Chlorogloea sp. CCALA 695 TaxID=2107693 RepID=UPI000D07B223|nr:BlaI/MecI/CopY family transcriptional regulator [Chlorogloea sp. CCALA 695]PSB33360.1 CopY family transcriptional regulator [Chlorogloea sp. CCALA 695]